MPNHNLTAYLEWLSGHKHGVVRVSVAEAKASELGLTLDSPKVFAAVESAGWCAVNGTSPLLVRYDAAAL